MLLRALRELRSRFSHSYERMSIQRVISLTFTAVAVAGALFIGLSLTLRYSAVNQKMQAQASQQVLAQVNLSLDNYLRRIMRVSDTVYYRLLKNADLAEGLPTDSLSLLYEENRDSLVSIAVFNSDGNLVTGAPLSELKAGADPASQGWFSTALGQIENIHFSTPHVQDLFQTADGSYHWVISLSRQVQLTRGGASESGVLLVDMSFSGVEQICRNTSLGAEGYLYIVDANGELIYHPRQQLIYAGLVQENNLSASRLSDGTHWEKFQGERRQVTVKTVGYTGWKLVGVVPVQGLAVTTAQFVLFVASVLLSSIFLLVFVNGRLSAHIADPIRRLEQAVRQTGRGGEMPQVPEEGCYEVRRLEHSIRSMVSTMRHLMDDIIQQEEDKRRSELEVLQSQINPHFLYNTLDSVIWLTESGRYEDSIRMVTALGRLFRISLSRGKRVIPLDSELDHAGYYMTIQRIRYKNKFTFEISRETDTAGLYCLKLIIQPLLENAIYHGMAAEDDDGRIVVRVWREGDDVYIDVTDNGLGMPPEVAASLLDESRPLPAKGSGIGVRNVHRRIQLAYGPRYGLEFYSEPDEGTTARIHLPVLTQPEEIGGKKEGMA